MLLANENNSAWLTAFLRPSTKCTIINFPTSQKSGNIDLKALERSILLVLL